MIGRGRGRICPDCLEREFDERRSTGAYLELEECADGKARCPACKSYYDQEHTCFICGQIRANIEIVDSVVVCAECKARIDSGGQARPSEIMREEAEGAKDLKR